MEANELHDSLTHAQVYSDWPSFPQLYVNGDLIGGCDIAEELDASGELRDILTPSLSKSSGPDFIKDRLKCLTKSADVMLFMKVIPVSLEAFRAPIVSNCTHRHMAQSLHGFKIDLHSFAGVAGHTTMRILSQGRLLPQILAVGPIEYCQSYTCTASMWRARTISKALKCLNGCVSSGPWVADDNGL